MALLLIQCKIELCGYKVTHSMMKLKVSHSTQLGRCSYDSLKKHFTKIDVNPLDVSILKLSLHFMYNVYSRSYVDVCKMFLERIIVAAALKNCLRDSYSTRNVGIL